MILSCAQESRAEKLPSAAMGKQMHVTSYEQHSNRGGLYKARLKINNVWNVGH